jgi:glyoxylase-like metal-dependent hydrolase (beta-lactamase superfamily II)
MTSVHRIPLPIPFPLKWVNAYYIHDSNPTLIDAGVNTEEAFEALEKGVHEAGGQIGALKNIIITHCHIDHVGLAGKVSDISGARIWLHKWDLNKLYRGNDDNFKSKTHTYRDFFVSAGIPEAPIDSAINSMYDRFKTYFGAVYKEETLQGGEVFPFDDFQLEVIHTPGHSPGSVCLLNGSSGDLFSGDTLLQDISSNPVAEITPPENGREYKSLAMFQKSLAHLREMDIETVLPGHGAEFHNHRERINELFERHNQRRAELLKLLRDYPKRGGKIYPMTLFTLSSELFPDLKGFDIFLGISEVRGHLEILEQEGLVVGSDVNGRRVYSLS